MIRLDQSIATSSSGARTPEPSGAAGGDAFAALFGAAGAVPIAAGEAEGGDRQAAAGPGKDLPVGDAALATEAPASDAQIAPILAILAEVTPPSPVPAVTPDEVTEDKSATLAVARDSADMSSTGMLAAAPNQVGERSEAAPVRISHSLRTTTALTAPAPPPQPVSALTALPEGQAAPVTAPARAILPAMSDDMGASEREPAPLPREGARRDASGLAAARKAIDMPAALPPASPSVTAEFRTPSATGSPGIAAARIPSSDGGAARATPDTKSVIALRAASTPPVIAPASAGAKPAPVEAVRAVDGAAIAVAARLTPAAVAAARGVAERASVNVASPAAVPTVAPPMAAARNDTPQVGTAAIATPTPATTPAQPAAVASPASAGGGAAPAAAPAAALSPSAPAVANVVTPATATAPVAGDAVTKPATLVADAVAVPRVSVAAGSVATSERSPERRAAPVAADRVVAPVASRVAASVPTDAIASPLRRAADPLADGPAPIARPLASSAPVPLVDPGASVAPATTAATTPTAPTPIDTRGPWIEAMIERIETARDSGVGESGAATRIRLSPDALGAVEIVLTPVGDGFDVQIVADSPAARALLAEASPRLAEMASDRGWRLAGGDAGAQGQAQHGQGGRHAAPAPRGTAHDTESAPEPGAARNWIA